MTVSFLLRAGACPLPVKLIGLPTGADAVVAVVVVGAGAGAFLTAGCRTEGFLWAASASC